MLYLVFIEEKLLTKFDTEILSEPRWTTSGMNVLVGVLTGGIDRFFKTFGFSWNMNQLLILSLASFLISPDYSGQRTLKDGD